MPSAPAKALLLILGETKQQPHVGAHVFSRKEYLSLLENGTYSRRFALSSITMSPRENEIGLTLSGGGLRAVAFHLGCLRALHDRNVLSQITAISAVSGGSIIAAMYAYSSCSFSQFEKQVKSLLRQGLTSLLLKKMLSPTKLAKSLWSTITIVAPELIDHSLSRVLSALGKEKRLAGVRQVGHSFSLRSAALVEALDEMLFNGAKLTDKRRNGVNLVFNATELRTGTAFRFGNRESGCWRHGKLCHNDLLLAKVVAYSALYPLAFPSFDEEFSFVDRSGNEVRRRVLISDGGIYDNLGVSCFQPGKDVNISSNVYSPDHLIVCDAGRGTFAGDDLPSWFIPRVMKSFDTTFRKAHDATIARLHQSVQHGLLRGFVLSYLGQQDDRLPYLPSDLIRLDDVRKYPTDLSPMSEEHIESISMRGEQLTRMLLSHYCPEL